MVARVGGRRFGSRAPLAKSELEDSWCYIFQHWSVDQASRYHRDLAPVMDAPGRGDKVGRVCTVRDGYRQYAVRTHIVFYRETETTPDVTRVLHQRHSGVAPTHGCPPSPRSTRARDPRLAVVDGRSP